jgi:hypothetical protein
LFVIGSRFRQALDGDGTRRTLRIRRLRCKGCRRIHHELPDFLVPYKRYTAAVIEAVVESTSTTSVVAASVEESTQRRWRRWAAILLPYWTAALAALRKRRPDQSADGLFDRSCSRLHELKQQIRVSTGWLSQLVQCLVVANLWIQTRFALGVQLGSR